jgi:hypothetical protein
MMETTPKEPQGGSRCGDALFAPVEERSAETGGSSTAAAETIEALEIDEDSVKSILELLCILGAAHKQLCQVCVRRTAILLLEFICRADLSVYAHFLAVPLSRGNSDLPSPSSRTVSHGMGASSGWPCVL